MKRKNLPTNLVLFIATILMIFSMTRCNVRSGKVESAELKTNGLVNKELYLGYRKLSEQLNIEALDDKFDGEQFRFWIHVLGTDTSRLIILSKVNGEDWMGQGYSFKERFDGNRSKPIDALKKQLTPKTGWEEIIRRLYKLNTDKFRYYRDIPEYNTGISTHCFEITLEYAKGGKHIILPYPCFEYYLKNTVEVTSLVDFISYLDGNLDLSLPKIWYSFPWEAK